MVRILGRVLLTGGLAVWAAPVWAAPEAELEVAPGPELEATTTEIHWAILRVDGQPWEEVRDVLQPRLPHVEILPFDDAAFETTRGELYAYVEVAVDPEPQGEVQLTIVLSDQRAYLRSFVPEPEGPLRSIATTIANTWMAIEQERIEADEEEVEIPRPEPEEEVEEPAKEEPTEPDEPDEPDEEVVAPEPMPAEEPPPLELGVTAALHPTFGLAPAAVRGFAALGAEGRVSLRQRRGFIVELGLRIGGRAEPDYRLWRNRLHLAAGYAWRGERFGVSAVAGPTAEPWVVRFDGSPAEPTPLGQAQASPLWGALVAVTPALRFRVAPALALQIGLRTEVTASVLSSGASARVLGFGATGSPDDLPSVLFTLGGVELSTALSLTLWISPPRAR